jgi:hypothetical protein
MADRKQIRDQLKTLISGVYAGEILIARRIDASELDEFVNIYISEGETQSEGIEKQSIAAMVVGINKKLATDDELDEIGDTIAAAIEENMTLDDLVAGLVYTGFQYGEDGTGFDQLFLKYTVIY